MKKIIIGVVLLLLLFFYFLISNDKEQVIKIEEKTNIPSKQEEELFSVNTKIVSNEIIKNEEAKDKDAMEEKFDEFLTIINQEPVEFLFSVDYLDERYREDQSKREKRIYDEDYEEYLLNKKSETISGIHSSMSPKDFFNALKKDSVSEKRIFFGETIDAFGSSIAFDNCFLGNQRSDFYDMDGYRINVELRNLLCRKTGYGFLINISKTIKKNENEESVNYKIESTLYNYGIYEGSETLDEMELFGNSFHVSNFFENESNGYIVN